MTARQGAKPWKYSQVSYTEICSKVAAQVELTLIFGEKWWSHFCSRRCWRQTPQRDRLRGSVLQRRRGVRAAAERRHQSQEGPEWDRSLPDQPETLDWGRKGEVQCFGEQRPVATKSFSMSHPSSQYVYWLSTARSWPVWDDQYGVKTLLISFVH